MVFFAGHGLRDQKLDHYFATADIEFALPAGRGRHPQEPRHQGCREDRERGSGAGVGHAERGRALEFLFADVRRGSGAVAIASAGGAEFALESDEWKNGVFTYSLLSTLGRGKSRVSEVRELVSEQVLELKEGKQRPTVRRENWNFDFEVY